MKKLISFIIALFIISSSTNAQSFFDRNKDTSFGFQFGVVDQHNHTHKAFQTFMFNFSIYGVYFDVGGWPRSHDSDVRIDTWHDECCFVYHIGYQLPVFKFLKITPIIGNYSHQIGYTDGSHWTVGPYGINNEFIVKKELEGLDYGVNIQIDINRGSIFGTFTKNTWYAGIGVNFDFFTNYQRRTNELLSINESGTSAVNCLCCKYCLPPSERENGRMCKYDTYNGEEEG